MLAHACGGLGMPPSIRTGAPHPGTSARRDALGGPPTGSGEPSQAQNRAAASITRATSSPGWTDDAERACASTLAQMLFASWEERAKLREAREVHRQHRVNQMRQFIQRQQAQQRVGLRAAIRAQPSPRLGGQAAEETHRQPSQPAVLMPSPAWLPSPPQWRVSAPAAASVAVPPPQPRVCAPACAAGSSGQPLENGAAGAPSEPVRTSQQRHNTPAINGDQRDSPVPAVRLAGMHEAPAIMAPGGAPVAHNSAHVAIAYFIFRQQRRARSEYTETVNATLAALAAHTSGARPNGRPLDGAPPKRTRPAQAGTPASRAEVCRAAHAATSPSTMRTTPPADARPAGITSPPKGRSIS